MTGVISRFVVGDLFEDPGFTATDNADTMVQGKVVRRGQEIINMNSPTPPDTPYTVSYNVADFSGESSRQRHMFVPKC